MSRVEVLLIILIPLYTTYDVISTNSIAFFVLYDFFSHFYNNQSLVFSKLSRASFWALIVFATVTVICENVEFIFDNRAQSALVANRTSEEHFYKDLATRYKYASNAAEMLASIACYTLLTLQFFLKSNHDERILLINRDH